MGRSTRRGPWLPEEDATLLHLVHIQGPNNWVRISQHMQHRSPKQCRERYHQNLKPTLNHEPITNDEGEVIEQLVLEMGKRWAEIARRLGNRSDNAVKNWWNGSMNRRRRNTTHSTARPVGPRQLPVSAAAPPRVETSFPQRPVFNSNSKTHSSPNHHHPSDLHTDLPRPRLLHCGTGHQSFESGLEYQFPPRPERQPYSMPPQSDTRRPPLPNTALSASGSAQSTPGEAYFRHLHPPSGHGLRPPPLDHRSASHTDWQSQRLPEAPVISPAATDYSNAPSFHQAPSLISDTQSHYSISPKTVSSPRPGMPAPIDTSNQNWYAEQRRNSYIPYSHVGKPLQDEGYVSALPASTSNEAPPETFPVDPSLMRTLSHSNAEINQDTRYTSLSSPAEKDSRMTVSRLLD